MNFQGMTANPHMTELNYSRRSYNSLPDVGQELDEVICGDFAAVLTIKRRKLSIHVQAALSVFKHLPGSDHTGQQSLSQILMMMCLSLSFFSQQLVT